MAGQRETKLEPATRALVEALGDLHLQAGRPSARAIASAARGGLSHTTVSDALSGRRLPKWPLMERIVSQLGGDENHFRELWIRAVADSSAPARSGSGAQEEDEALVAQYRALVATRAGKLTLPASRPIRRIPIAEVFVAPRIVEEGADGRHSVSLDHFDDSIGHTVIFGEPGSGKSTLSDWLMYRHATSNELALPFLVNVDKLAGDVSSGKSVVDYLEREISTLYLLDLTTDLIRRVFAEKPTLIVFDGLDIAPIPVIVQAIELFGERFPRCRMLVTSRPGGDAQALLGSGRFSVFRLESFDSAQVERYVTNLFVASGEDPRIAHAFLEERNRQSVDAFLSNPLSLAIACEMYREYGTYIGDGAALYGRYWEHRVRTQSAKQLDYWERFGRPILRRVAMLMLMRGDPAHTVSERDLVKLATRYLASRLEDIDEIEGAVREIIDYFKGRSWLLTEDGLSDRGELQFRFFHQTFFDYQAALALLEEFRTPLELAHRLAPQLAAGEWLEIGQHVVHLADRYSEEGAEQVLSEIFRSYDELPRDGRRNLQGFLERALVQNRTSPDFELRMRKQYLQS